MLYKSLKNVYNYILYIFIPRLTLFKNCHTKNISVTMQFSNSYFYNSFKNLKIVTFISNNILLLKKTTIKFSLAPLQQINCRATHSYLLNFVTCGIRIATVRLRGTLRLRRVLLEIAVTPGMASSDNTVIRVIVTCRGCQLHCVASDGLLVIQGRRLGSKCWWFQLRVYLIRK